VRALSEIGMRANVGLAYASRPFMDKVIIEETETKYKELANRDEKSW